MPLRYFCQEILVIEGIPALKNTRASSFDVTHAALTPVVPLSRHRGDLREQARTVGTV